MTGPTGYPNLALRGRRWADESIQRPSLYYCAMRWLCRMTFVSVFSFRAFDRQYEPATGSAVYICNHQSFLDPMVMGLSLIRPVNYMARDTLFRFGPFGALIKSVNAFPVRRGTADLAAIKEAMRRLRAGGQVLVFPEGTRTRDGRIGPLLPGVAILSQRTADWTVPVAIDGAFEAWPRTNALPRPGRIWVQYGRPIPQAEARTKTAQQFVHDLRESMIGLQDALRRRAGKEPFSYPSSQTPQE